MKKLLVLILTSSFLVSCASKVQKDFQENLKNAQPVNTVTDAKQNVANIIDQSSSLSDEQKVKLKAIKENTSQKVAEIYQKGLKLHELMAMEYAKEKRSDRMIRKIKKEMIANSNERLQAIFKGLKEADEVVGRNVSNKNEIFRQISLEHVGARDL